MTVRRDELVEFMKDVAGEYLRGVLAYDENGFEVVYLRDDIVEKRVADPTLQDDLPIIHELALQEERIPAEVGAFGRYHATVRVFSNAVVIQLVSGEKRGYGVSLDTEAARQLNNFIRRCTSYMDENTDDQ